MLLFAETLSSRSGKLSRDLPTARWAGVMGVRSLMSSLTVVSGLKLRTASILVRTVANS